MLVTGNGQCAGDICKDQALPGEQADWNAMKAHNGWSHNWVAAAETFCVIVLKLYGLQWIKGATSTLILHLINEYRVIDE